MSILDTFNYLKEASEQINEGSANAKFIQFKVKQIADEFAKIKKSDQYDDRSIRESIETIATLFDLIAKEMLKESIDDFNVENIASELQSAFKNVKIGKTDGQQVKGNHGIDKV